SSIPAWARGRPPSRSRSKGTSLLRRTSGVIRITPFNSTRRLSRTAWYSASPRTIGFSASTKRPARRPGAIPRDRRPERDRPAADNQEARAAADNQEARAAADAAEAEWAEAEWATVPVTDRSSTRDRCCWP